MTQTFFFVTNHTRSGKKNSGDLNAGEKPTLFCLAITNHIFFCFPMFVFALPTNPCLHLMLHHYTPIHSSQPYLLLYATLLKQNNPSIYNFPHLPLHHTTPTFYYAMLCYMLHFSTLQLQTILLEFYPFSDTPNYIHSLLSTTLCYTLHPTTQSLHLHTNHYTFTWMLLCDLLQSTILPSGNTIATPS